MGMGSGMTSLDTSVPAGTSPLRGHFVLNVEREKGHTDKIASCLQDAFPPV